MVTRSFVDTLAISFELILGEQVVKIPFKAFISVGNLLINAHWSLTSKQKSAVICSKSLTKGF